MSESGLGWKGVRLAAEAVQNEATRQWSEKPSSPERLRRYPHITPGLSVNVWTKPTCGYSVGSPLRLGNAQNQNTVIKQ